MTDRYQVQTTDFDFLEVDATDENDAAEQARQAGGRPVGIVRVERLDGGGDPRMTVRVRDNAAEARAWGRGPGGVILRTVTVGTSCPRCGGPRGKVRGLNSCSDGEYYHVHVWNNPCGHTDMYDDVVAEGKKWAEAHEVTTR